MREQDLPPSPVQQLHQTTVGLGADERQVIEALKRNVRYLRGEVAKRVNLKFSAQLKFLPDESFDEASHIDALLRRPDVSRDLDEAE